MKNKVLKTAYWIALLAVLITPIIQVGEDLGLYFDSVMPDFAAAQIVFPANGITSHFFSFPYLAQIYHGTPSMWLSAIVILIARGTSCLQHNMISAVEVFLCIILLDRIFKQLQVEEWIRRSVLFLCAAMPTLFTVSIMQYYVELPGILASLLMVLLYEKARMAEGKKQTLLEYGSFLCGGFAFYSYCNFIFLLPGMLILQLMNGKDRKERLKKVLTGCCGYLSGCVLYIAGFVQFLRGSIGQSVNDILLPLFACLIVAAVCTFLVKRLMNGKVYSTFGIAIGMALAGGAGFCWYYRGAMGNLLNTAVHMNERGPTVGAASFRMMLNYLSYAITGVKAERLIFGQQINRGGVLWVAFFALAEVLFIIAALRAEKTSARRSAVQYLLVIHIYLLGCIPFVAKMQTQHFVVIVFWLVLAAGLEIQVIMAALICDKKRTGVRAAAVACMLVIAALGLFQSSNIVSSIKQTGGTGYYTNQINVMAAEALENKSAGVKELYVFPQWGFRTGFNYLTCNQVELTEDASEDDIICLTEDGYEVAVVLWNNAEADTMLSKYTAVENAEVSVKEYYEKGGKLAFYKVVISSER